MSNDLNLCQFIGRLGQNPEIRYTQGGDAVASFTIAVGWKTKDKEGTEWVRCSAFGKLAEIIGKYLVKGSQVYISGRFQTRKWTNKDGVERYSTEIVAGEMQMLGGRSEQQSGQKSRPQQAPQAAGWSADDDGDGIPF